MIDTIILTFRQDMFTITYPDKFEPSAKGLFDNSYRLGGRANMRCYQNPTQSELKNGIYKPRLTVSKRMNRENQTEIMMKVEFSAPKLLFGNNFDELENMDFENILQLLGSKLQDMGVVVDKQTLISAPVSAIHFSKNIWFTDYTTAYTYLVKLSNVNMNQRLDINKTDFRNEGHSLKFHANSYEIAFYDKLKDLDKAKLSEKRAEEKDNNIQLNTLNNIKFKKPFEVLRMEIRLNKKQKLLHILKRVDIHDEPTLKMLFNKETAKKVLLYYIEQLETAYPVLLEYPIDDTEAFFRDFKLQNPDATLKKAFQAYGLRKSLEYKSMREIREITKMYGNANWYKLFAESKKISNLQKESPFIVLKAAIQEFKSLKLIDFSIPTSNNEATN